MTLCTRKLALFLLDGSNLYSWEVIPLKPQSRRKYKMAKKGKKYIEAAKLS